MSKNRYRVSISFSYDLETDKDHNEAQAEAEENLNTLTANIILNRKQVKLEKIRQPKHKLVLGEFTVDEVLPYISREDRKREYRVGETVYEVRMDSSRYFVFRENLCCSACGLEGVKFCLERSPSDKNPHFNLYGIENGRLILMTKDHIKPKSKGGKNIFQNYQTYCCICNNLKGDNIKLTNQQINELRNTYNENKNLPRKRLKKLLDIYRINMTNNLSNSHNKILGEWDYKKNNLHPSKISYGSNKKVWWKCKNGHEWETTIASRTILNHGCPYCVNKKIDENNCLATLCPYLIKEWHPKNVIDPYTIGTGFTKKVWWICSVCKYEWEARVNFRTGAGVIKSTGCPNCAGIIPNAHNCLSKLYPELIREWHSKNTVSPSSFLPHSRKKVWWFGVCGHEWEASIGNRVSGTGCPICRESKGERAIKNHLISKNITYEKQYRFEKCRDKYKLPFDFAIFIGNKIALIEYQGQQHFFPIEIFGGEKVYNETINRDEIKRKFCLQVKIPLLVISYKDVKNIGILLDNFINKL